MVDVAMAAVTGVVSRKRTQYLAYLPICSNASLEVADHDCTTVHRSPPTTAGPIRQPQSQSHLLPARATDNRMGLKAP
jgi:hypothetical protein